MPKSINDLRDVLFDTLASLRNEEKPMEIDRAKAISDIAGRLIETAKVECQYVELMGGGRATGFIESDGLPPAPPTKPVVQAALPGKQR